MASLNRTILIGNYTRATEKRVTPSGDSVVSFGIAINNNYTNKDGEKVEGVDFFNVVAWKKVAENCDKYLSKGKPVAIEGRLKSRSWEAEDGSKRSAVEVVAQSVQFLGSGDNSEKAESKEEPVEEEIDLGSSIPF